MGIYIQEIQEKKRCRQFDVKKEISPLVREPHMAVFASFETKPFSLTPKKFSMPRIPPQVLHAARRQHRLLPLLLPANRSSFDAAWSELRWILKELPPSKHLAAARLRQHFVPLQYILGSQPFGSLDILCRPGVLIPRWETEEWAGRLSKLISRHLPAPRPRVFVDLCTGTGCIPLLLASPQTATDSAVIGADISPKALALFNRNVAHNYPSSSLSPNSIYSVRADVLASSELLATSLRHVLLDDPINGNKTRALSDGDSTGPQNRHTIRLSSLSKQDYDGASPHLPWTNSRNSLDNCSKLSFKVDLITANPPYIPLHQYDPTSLPGLKSSNSSRLNESGVEFNQTSEIEVTDRSVRLYEPKLALVGDKEFYYAIFLHSLYLDADAVVCEVGDLSQIDYMIDLARKDNSVSGKSPWKWLRVDDSNQKPRVVVLWRKDSDWEFLDQMADKSIW